MTKRRVYDYRKLCFTKFCPLFAGFLAVGFFHQKLTNANNESPMKERCVDSMFFLLN